VSADIKTEDPLRTAIKGGLMLNPMTMPLGVASQYLMPEGNLTDTAGEYAGAAWDATGSAWDWATDW
jgi:hypothetical protein